MGPDSLKGGDGEDGRQQDDGGRACQARGGVGRDHHGAAGAHDGRVRARAGGDRSSRGCRTVFRGDGEEGQEVGLVALLQLKGEVVAGRQGWVGRPQEGGHLSGGWPCQLPVDAAPRKHHSLVKVLIGTRLFSGPRRTVIEIGCDLSERPGQRRDDVPRPGHRCS